MIKSLPKYCKLFLLINLLSLCSPSVEAKRPEYHLDIKNHLFYPAQIIIPANKKVKLVIHNRDNSVEEFDSFDLNREKVIFPKQKSIVFIGPLSVGEYSFFGEYHPNSARGKVIVAETKRKQAASHDALKLKQGSLHVH
ncbi:cupredoxin domain-containing protein [Candidatus Colwellia aromaticivorans]|uniref:cupredoxin domain-containing protein n=1 Tax=Candidatus Colwellia aromaticivorans TaxID=2267621 RepID=UPI000DF45FDA|nr:cupredoxin domain-containing protein [Candidatus Colwellia aromaticivorans]